MNFNAFVGVDWSGAKGSAYSGIAVARCGAGDAPPVLVGPPGKRWRRSDFVEWLIEETESGDRMLVGIDCAFALPADMAGTLLGDAYKASDLWDHIDCICDGADDFYGGAYAQHELHAPWFWASGRRRPDFAEHHRATELACRDQKMGRPESPLKLIGPKQVGKGGLAGMRVLAALKRRLGDTLCVWPFDRNEDRAAIVCAELFPRLFLQKADHGNGKVRNQHELDRCLAALGSRPYAGSVDPKRDHDTDALVAAAGLRTIADDPRIWAPAGLNALARRAEGWILGVR